MNNIVVKSFDEYIGIISSHKKGDITLFRGQEDNFPLLPKIARKDPNIDTAETEMGMLEPAKEASKGVKSTVDVFGL